MEVTQQQQQQQRRQQRCWRQGNSPRAAVFAGCQHCSLKIVFLLSLTERGLAEHGLNKLQVCSLPSPIDSPASPHHVYVCHAWHPAVQLFHEPHILLNSTLHTVLC